MMLGGWGVWGSAAAAEAAGEGLAVSRWGSRRILAGSEAACARAARAPAGSALRLPARSPADAAGPLPRQCAPAPPSPQLHGEGGEGTHHGAHRAACRGGGGQGFGMRCRQATLTERQAVGRRQGAQGTHPMCWKLPQGMQSRAHVKMLTKKRICWGGRGREGSRRAVGAGGQSMHSHAELQCPADPSSQPLSPTLPYSPQSHPAW